MRPTEVIVVRGDRVAQAVAEALAEQDIAKGTDLSNHTALTTTAHGGIVAADDPRLTNSRDPNAHGHAASGISTLPTGDVAATNVQQAISELDAEKQKLSGKNTANGYMGLNASGLAPPERLGSGDRNGTRVLRDDGAWVDPSTASVGAATEDAAGVAELATTDEVQTGTDTTRVVTPAGLSSVLGLDMLRLLASEVSITVAKTVPTTDIGKMHVCSGSSYTVTLPSPSGRAGKTIGFRITASGLVTLSSSAQIDGQTTRVMWAGESAVLLSDGTRWTKIAGRSRPMSAQIRLTNPSTPQQAQLVPNNKIEDVNLNTVDFNEGNLADTTNNRILIRRPGTYTVNAAVRFEFGGPSPRVIVLAVRGSDSSAVVQSESSVSATSVSPAASGTETVSFAAADNLRLQAFHTTGSSRNLTGEVSSVSSPHISVAEITSW